MSSRSLETILPSGRVDNLFNWIQSYPYREVTIADIPTGVGLQCAKHTGSASRLPWG
jgi:hypothetical protein